jgi:hypothetical protein
MKKLVISKENPNGILVDLTSEELAQRELDLTYIEELKQIKIDKEARIASAKAKLAALGLTEAEIKDTFRI